jgi:hypothetical protein
MSHAAASRGGPFLGQVFSARRHASWRADLVSAARIGLSELARDVEDLVEVGAIDDIEAEQLLLGLGEGTVDHERRFAVLAQGRRRGRRQEAGDRPELALACDLLVHDRELRHHGLVMLLRPGAGDLLVVIAEDGVLHRDHLVVGFGRRSRLRGRACRQASSSAF